MSKSKTKINNNIKPVYFKLLGATWLAFFILLLAKTDALKNFGVLFFGGNVCGSCTQVSLLSLGLCFLIFALGGLSLAYGVLLKESDPNLTAGRIIAFTCAIAGASLVVFGWVNFIVNY